MLACSKWSTMLWEIGISFLCLNVFFINLLCCCGFHWKPSLDYVCMLHGDFIGVPVWSFWAFRIFGLLKVMNVCGCCSSFCPVQNFFMILFGLLLICCMLLFSCHEDCHDRILIDDDFNEHAQEFGLNVYWFVASLPWLVVAIHLLLFLVDWSSWMMSLCFCLFCFGSIPWSWIIAWLLNPNAVCKFPELELQFVDVVCIAKTLNCMSCQENLRNMPCYCLW